MQDTGSQDVPLLAHLAGFAAHLQRDGIPDHVWHEAKLCIIDTVGCIVAGARRPEAMAVLEAELGSGSRAESSAYAQGRKLSAEAAVRFNGYAGDLLELNDLIGGHASIANVTAALALAEHLQCSGEALVRAIVAGIETTARVYTAYYGSMKRLTEAGIAPPGVPSTIGVAAVASVLLGFDEQRTLAALSNAAALAGWCPAECFFGEGGTVKPMLHGAWPASVGLLAARYARSGIDGPHRVLESNIGYYKTVGQTYDPAVITGAKVWYLAKPRRKFHACCGYIHAGADVMGMLKAAHPDQLRSAREIRIAVPAYTVTVIAKPNPPATPNEARFHLQYCLALCASGIDAVLPEHSDDFDKYVERPEIRAWMERMYVVPDERFTHYQECAITLVDPDGREVVAQTQAPRGAPENPLTEQQIVDKFVRLVHPVSGSAGPAEFVERVLALEDEANCVWIPACFEPGKAK